VLHEFPSPCRTRSGPRWRLGHWPASCLRCCLDPLHRRISSVTWSAVPLPRRHS